MKHDIIQQLTADLRPVQPLPSPLVRWLRWLLATFLCLAAGVALCGLRDDIGRSMLSTAFELQTAGLLAVCCFSGLTALLLSVPGERIRWTTTMTALSLALWAGILIVILSRTDQPETEAQFGCVRMITLQGLVPGVALFFMLRGAAPQRRLITGFFAALAMASAGALSTQFICDKTDALHLLLWHFLPVVLIGAVGMAIGRWFFRRLP